MARRISYAERGHSVEDMEEEEEAKKKKAPLNEAILAFLARNHTPAEGRSKRRTPDPSTVFAMMKLTGLVLTVAVCIACAAPKQPACQQCGELIWDQEIAPGHHSEAKSFNTEGCAILDISCTGKTKRSSTFLEFNGGDLGGLSKIGEQRMQFTCGADAKWHLVANGENPTIASVSCSSLD